MFGLLSYYSISLFLGGIIALLSGAAVYFADPKKNTSQAWMLLNISTSIWSFGYFGMLISNNSDTAWRNDLILHYGAILIPVFYLYFVLSLTDRVLKNKGFIMLSGLAALFFTVFNHTPLFVDSVFPKAPLAYAPNAGPLYIYFAIYFFVIVIYAQSSLLRTILKNKNGSDLRLRYVFYSALFGFIGGGSVFFLTFNIPFPPYPIILFALYPIIIAYAMIRHKLFNIKVISTEILIGSIWLLLLFRVLLSQSLEDQIINIVLLLATTFFGILLIRNVEREVDQREKIEKLAKDLESANERLKEVDQLKSEFVSLATHQIRGPLTAIKGYASLVLEGDYGDVPPSIKPAIETIAQSTQSLVTIVGDFLDVSRIEQGRMKYDFIDFDLSILLKELLNELKPNIEKKGLKLSATIEPAILLVADQGKIKQILSNLIDNSIKYTPQGSITIDLKKTGNNILFTIKDTGVGMKAETIPKLFQKFSRAEDASKANILGTGLGLYVAKEMVKAHNGRIWAESEGQGKGSAFYVELKGK
jgi:signal transduction histidine kinase